MYSCIKFLNSSAYKTIEKNKMRQMDDILLRIEGKDFIISSNELIDSDFGEVDESVEKRSSFE